MRVQSSCLPVVANWRFRLALASLIFVVTCDKGNSNLQRIDETEGTERRIGTMKDGKKHGQWIRYDDGALYEIEHFHEGVQHGWFRRFHEDGRLLSDGVYQNGLIHGRYRIFFETGQIAQLSFFDLGRRDLTWCMWHPDGALERLIVYQDDQVMREERNPPGTCPLLQGEGARHLDPKNTDVR